MNGFDLDRLERWMLAVVTHPEGVTEGLRSGRARRHRDVAPGDLESVVLPSRKLSPARRLGIYSHMYHARLIECLETDFLALKHACGDRFRDIVRRFIERRPSRHPDLNSYGRELADFLRAESGERDAAFLAELALLERSQVDVFHERQVEPVSAERLGSIPEEAWQNARFRLVPAHRLLHLRYPVVSYWQSVKAGGNPIPPGREAGAALVSRRNFRVSTTGLSLEQARLLAGLAEGQTLGEALQILASAPEAGEGILERLSGWFQEWTELGLLAEVETTVDER